MWARKNKEINPRRLERRALCFCQFKLQRTLGHLDWRRMCCRNGAPRAGGAPSSWQQQWDSFCSPSTLSDLACSFDFRIQREELPILVLTTYLGLEAMVHLPEFLIWAEEAGGRGSHKVQQRESAALAPPLGTSVLGRREQALRKIAPSFSLARWAFSGRCFLSAYPVSVGFYLWGTSILIANSFLLGETLRWPAA